MSALASPFRALVLIPLAGIVGESLAAPTITQQPQATVIVTSGQPATFSVEATGVGAVRWQWRRTGGPLAGQTGKTLDLPTATMAEAGFYDVVVSDDTGSVASAPARLLVTPVGGYPNTLRLDTSFNPTFERDWASIAGTTVGPDGEVYVFGSFSSISGEPHAAIARFSADLVVDSSFRPSVASSVSAVVVQSDGKPILVTTMRRPDGRTVGPVVRLNHDGSEDVGFNPPELKYRNSNDATIRRLAVTEDGKLLISGYFDTVGALNRRALARLNPDGTPDSGFRADLGTSPYVESIVLVGHKVVVLGSFVVPGRTGTQQIVRLNSDGSIDLSFANSQLAYSYPKCLLADGSGRLYAGAQFTAGAYSKTNTLVRLLDDGSIDPTYQCELDEVPAYGSAFPDGRVAIICTKRWPNTFGCLNDTGGILWRKDFTVSNSNWALSAIAVAGPDGFYLAPAATGAVSSPLSGVALFRTDGSLVKAAPIGIRSTALPGMAIPVAGQKWVVAGNFDYTNGVSTPGIVRLNPDGTADTTFTPPSLGLPAVADLVTQGDGAILAVGGGQTVARRLRPDGQLDSSFVFNAGSGFGSSSPANMAVLADGRIAATGWISAYNGEMINAGVIIIQANGPRETAFAPQFQTTGNPFNRLVAAPGGGLAFCGDFKFEGTLMPLSWMAPTGGWFYMKLQGSACGVGFDASGRLLAAIPSGTTLMRVDGLGSVVPPGPDPARASLSFSGAAIAAQTDNRVLIEGSCRPLTNGPIHGPVLRLNADDSLDTTFRLVDLAATATPAVRATMQYTDDGRLLVCGGYGSRGSIGVSGLAMFKPEALPPPPVITRQPVAVSARLGQHVELSVEASGEVVNCRWYRNGSPLALGRTLVLPAVSASDFGSYTAEIVGPADSVRSNAVQVSQCLPQPFADWIAASDAPADQRDALDSPAGDGVPNLIKYALGVAPMDNAATQLPALTLVEASGQPPALALIFPENPQAEGIRYALQISTDLVSWAEVDAVAEAFGTNAAGAALVRLRELQPATAARRFARLAIVTETR